MFMHLVACTLKKVLCLVFIRYWSRCWNFCG